MANFDVSFLNPKMKKSSGASKDYGFLIDSLAIKKNALESDGKLSPGDYDLLEAEAQKMYAHPGLTEAQRSNIEVQISSFRSDKAKNVIKDSGDIARINREVKDDLATATRLVANDPAKFLSARAMTLDAKIDRLSESIDLAEEAGDDASPYYNELTASLQEYNDTFAAIEDIESWDGASAPKSNYAAYVVTNKNGEVVDLKIDRVGGTTGYLETNGVYGGLPLYGKVNRKEFGKNVFVLGSQTYQAADMVIPGPDGSLKPAMLFETNSIQGKKGGYTIAESGYVPVNLDGVRTQTAIRPGGWMEGDKGFLYQMQEDGSYKKYVNYDKEELGISDNDILRMPRSFEQGILGSVRETVDGSIAPEVPVPAVGTSTPMGVGMSTTTPTGAQVPAQSGGRPNTGGAPTERVGSRAMDVAGKAMKFAQAVTNPLAAGAAAAGGFLGKLFSK